MLTERDARKKELDAAIKNCKAVGDSFIITDEEAAMIFEYLRKRDGKEIH